MHGIFGRWKSGKSHIELPGRLRLTAEGVRNRVLQEEGIRRKQV